MKAVTRRRRKRGMRGKPMVSIIILAAGDGRATGECLESLARFTEGQTADVILVDNGCSEKESVILEREARRIVRFPVRLLRFSHNFGYARANNQAAALARGDVLVFLNNDVIVTPGWLSPLVNSLQKDAMIAVCQPKLKSQVAKAYFDYSGGGGGFLDVFGYPFTRGRVFDSVEKDVGQYDQAREITWASGSCFAIRAALFRKAGGFDDYFFSYFEEIDLCVRLRKMGYRIVCEPRSVVYHHGAYTSNRNLPHKIYMNHRNNLYFFLKHHPIGPDGWLYPVRVFLDVLSVGYYLWQGRLSFAWSVIAVYGALVIHFPLLLGVIKFRGRGFAGVPTVYQGSVVVDYFLLGKKNFDQIMGRRGEGRSYKRYEEVTYFLDFVQTQNAKLKSQNYISKRKS